MLQNGSRNADVEHARTDAQIAASYAKIALRYPKFAGLLAKRSSMRTG